MKSIEVQKSIRAYGIKPSTNAGVAEGLGSGLQTRFTPVQIRPPAFGLCPYAFHIGWRGYSPLTIEIQFNNTGGASPWV